MPGSTLRVRSGDRREILRVLGLVDTGRAGGRQLLDGVLLMDVAAAQRLLGMEGRLSYVDLILADPPRDARAIESWLPPYARLVRANEQADTVAQLTAAFELNLEALSLLALVVGMFLVYNTVLFSVVQRRAVFGTLRTLGATPGQLFGLILAETLATAALGAALGLGLGYLLGQSAVRLVTRTINDLYYVVAVSGAPLTLATAAEGRADGAGGGGARRPRSGDRSRARRARDGAPAEHLRGAGAPAGAGAGRGRRRDRPGGCRGAGARHALAGAELRRPVRSRAGDGARRARLHGRR